MGKENILEKETLEKKIALLQAEVARLAKELEKKAAEVNSGADEKGNAKETPATDAEKPDKISSKNEDVDVKIEQVESEFVFFKFFISRPYDLSEAFMQISVLARAAEREGQRGQFGSRIQGASSTDIKIFIYSRLRCIQGTSQ